LEEAAELGIVVAVAIIVDAKRGDPFPALE
jgi:hypothetical protein